MMFLTIEEIAELTGIKRGRDGKPRAYFQCEHLRKLGIPFFPNASGEPKVARAVIEGRIESSIPKPQPKWQPAVLQKAA
jgi:hypothetical protein